MMILDMWGFSLSLGTKVFLIVYIELIAREYEVLMVSTTSIHERTM